MILSVWMLISAGVFAGAEQKVDETQEDVLVIAYASQQEVDETQQVGKETDGGETADGPQKKICDRCGKVHTTIPQIVICYFFRVVHLVMDFFRSFTGE